MARLAMVVLGLAFVGFASAPVASADGEFDGSVYLIISFDDAFEFNEDGGTGSQTILVNIGTFVGAGSVVETRFINRQLSMIPMPPGKTIADFNGNEATVLGTFQTTGDSPQIHLVSPMPDAVPPEIQAAVHNASLAGALDALAAPGELGPTFPTTYQIAATIHGFLGGGEFPPFSVGEVASYLFGVSVPMGTDDDRAFAEGDLFPHEPGSKLFRFNLSFDDDGEFESDVCLVVDADVKPGSKNTVNFEKEGKLKVAFLSSSTFDATEVDDTTAEIGGVAALDSEIKDVNKDGLDDIVIRFDCTDLKAGGALTASTTSLTMRAHLTDGTCVEGTDSIDLH
jgi:hypothetical protein